MADNKNNVKKIHYISDNITQGLSYFQQQNFKGLSKIVLVAEVIDNRTIEIGLLGAFKENPLILDNVIKELQNLVNERVDGITDIDVLDITN